MVESILIVMTSVLSYLVYTSAMYNTKKNIPTTD